MAAPQTNTTLESTPYSAEDDPALANIDPALRQSRPDYLLNASLGFAGGNYLEQDEYEQGPFFALRFMPLESDTAVDGTIKSR